MGVVLPGGWVAARAPCIVAVFLLHGAGSVHKPAYAAEIIGDNIIQIHVCLSCCGCNGSHSGQSIGSTNVISFFVPSVGIFIFFESGLVVAGDGGVCSCLENHFAAL